MDGSYAVADPEITHVQDTESGSLIPASDAIGSDYGKVIELRMALKSSIARDKPKYTCHLCGTVVYLVCRKDTRRFFFRHVLEDGRCPAKTRSKLSEEEINARRYNGAKESLAHQRMKEIVSESLDYDSSFSERAVEKVWKGKDRVSWRKPDVQALFNDLRVAFEIQLSTTFLHVIAERREFYLREGGLLCWVFKSFDADRSRLTQDDVFYNNNRNIFLASEETLSASREAGKLILECRWAEPAFEDGKIVSRWNGRLVAFDELKIDRERQRVFLFDYDEALRAVTHEFDTVSLRDRFEKFWINRDPYPWRYSPDWGWLQNQLANRSISLPDNPYDGDGLAFLLDALYSAKHGRPIGWRHKKLIEVAHRVEGSYKSFLRAFRSALSAYGRADQIRQEDMSGKWRRKVKTYRPLINAEDKLYEPNRGFDALVSFLFPEIGSY